MKLSEHFHLSEFTTSGEAARRGINNTPPPAAIAALTALCTHVLEPVRRKFGPVRITSGYRSPALNRAIKGSKRSKHMIGEAADFEVPGVSNFELAKWIAENMDFDQLILEFYTPGDGNSGWVHCSWRATGRRKQVLTAQLVRRMGLKKTVYVPGLVR